MRLPKFRLQSLSAIARVLRSHQEMRRAGDKNTKRRSSRPPAWLLVVLALLVALFVVSAKSASPHRQSDRKSTRLNSSHVAISYAVFCLKKKIHATHRHVL